MLSWIWSKKVAFIQCVIRLCVQAIFTLILAYFIRQTLTNWVDQVNIAQEYFPNGSTFQSELRQSNGYRLKVAQTYLKNANIVNFNVNQASKRRLAIGIIAAYRNNNFYLTQTLGYLLYQLKSFQVPILICFVEEKGNEEIAELQRLGIKVDFLYQNRSFPNIPHGSNDQRIAKESDDYWNCLDKTAKIGNSSYVLMLEDDSISLPDLQIQLESLMYQLTSNERRQPIDYIKLFHPWYLRKIPSFIQIPIICILISLLPVLFIRSLRLNSLYYLNAILISLVLINVCVEESQQLIPDTRFALTNSAYLSYPESCCTQAILFRSSSIPNIIKQLSTIPTFIGYAKDHVIDDSSFLGRMVDRNLFIHVGHYSAVRQNLVEFRQT